MIAEMPSMGRARVDHDAQGHAAGRGLPSRPAVQQGNLGDQGKIRARQDDQNRGQGHKEQEVFQ